MQLFNASWALLSVQMICSTKLVDVINTVEGVKSVSSTIAGV